MHQTPDNQAPRKLHNIVHLIFGVLGLIAAAGAADARTFLIGGGVIYLALWLHGPLVDQHSDTDFVPLDNADTSASAWSPSAPCCRAG